MGARVYWAPATPSAVQVLGGRGEALRGCPVRGSSGGQAGWGETPQGGSRGGEDRAPPGLVSQDRLSRCPQVQPHILPHLPAAPWSPCPPTPAATQATRSPQGQRRASARGRAPGQSPPPRTCCHQPGTLHPASLTLCPQHTGHSGSPPRRATCSRPAAVTEKSQLVRGRGLPHTAGREHGPARPQPPRHGGKVCMPAGASGCSEGHSGLGPHGQGQQFSVAALAAPGPEGGGCRTL